MDRITVDQAKAMMRDNYAQMRREYTKMRDIAQKRLQRLGKSEFAYTKAFSEHIGGFTKLRDIPKENFAKAFSELSKFVTAKGSTITGQHSIMEKTIRTWNEQGIPLTRETYRRTISILEEMRRRKIVYGSDTAEELARLTMGLSEMQFADIMDNLELFLTHTTELKDFMDSRYDEQTGWEKVDMREFADLTGW